nr:MAG TPA: hypothetical protein [Caudoviricetes sp.]
MRNCFHITSTVLSVFCDSYFCLSITVLTVTIKAYRERDL